MCISYNMYHTCTSMHKQNFNIIYSLFLKTLRKNEILTSTKGHNYADKFKKILCVSHNTAYTKFIQIHQFALKMLNGNKILTSIKGHNSVEK